MKGVTAWLKSNSFLVGLVAMIGAAWLVPDLGVQGGILHSEVTRRVAVFVIFFLQGLGLPTEELKQGVAQWKVHGFTLSWNYLGFPVIVCAAFLLIGGAFAPEIRFGFIYLAMLPTTITSAVFFTSAARGNVATAVFSTAISNLLSVFLVPVGVALLLFQGGEEATSLSVMFLRLCQLIVLPMFLGQLLRPFSKSFVPRLKPWFKRLTTTAIFFIMFCTFCEGVKAAAWETLGWGAVAFSFLGAAGMLMAFAGLVWWASGLATFDFSTRIAAFFCGSQKSLATGVPMAVSIFPVGGSLAGIPEVSVIVLPLMCYHFLQLALAARLADRFGKRD